LIKDIDLKDMQNKIKELVVRVDKKADQKNLDELSELVQKLQEELDALKSNTEEINKLRTRMDLLETKFVSLSKTINELTVKIDKGGKKEQDKGNYFAQNAGAHIEEEEWSELKKTIERIKKELSDVLKDLDGLKELKKRVYSLEGLMDTKLDKEEFEKWKLSNDLGQTLSGILKKFADRNEVLKAMKKLENRILLIEEEMAREGGVIDNGENAMFAKKPLGGWSCASCQKDLINIEGLKVQYHPWAKLPQRNPSERIAKVT
jgi:chromosome segregation ATPase